MNPPPTRAVAAVSMLEPYFDTDTRITLTLNAGTRQIPAIEQITGRHPAVATRITGPARRAAEILFVEDGAPVRTTFAAVRLMQVEVATEPGPS